MITKEQRDRDTAICEAATTDWREGAVEKWHLYCRATHPDRASDERVLMRANEHFPYEADVRAAAHCRNRLPAYIAAAEEMERRIERIEEMATGWARAAEKHTLAGEHDEARVCRAKSSALQGAARLLRGEP